LDVQRADPVAKLDCALRGFDVLQHKSQVDEPADMVQYRFRIQAVDSTSRRERNSDSSLVILWGQIA
jgi:hypothetical protein